jgi:transcriptional regulator of PTS gene
MSSSLHGQPLRWIPLRRGAQGDLLAKDIITGVGITLAAFWRLVNLFNPQKILIGSPLSQAAEIFSRITACIRSSRFPPTAGILRESTQFSNQGTMAGAALVKDAMYNGSLLIRLLQG